MLNPCSLAQLLSSEPHLSHTLASTQGDAKMVTSSMMSRIPWSLQTLRRVLKKEAGGVKKPPSPMIGSTMIAAVSSGVTWTSHCPQAHTTIPQVVQGMLCQSCQRHADQGHARSISKGLMPDCYRDLIERHKGITNTPPCTKVPLHEAVSSKSTASTDHNMHRHVFV